MQASDQERKKEREEKTELPALFHQALPATRGKKLVMAGCILPQKTGIFPVKKKVFNDFKKRIFIE